MYAFRMKLFRAALAGVSVAAGAYVLACSSLDSASDSDVDAGADAREDTDAGTAEGTDAAAPKDASPTDAGEPDGEAGAPPAGAHVVGYVFGDQESAANPYVASSASSYNVLGGPITVSRGATGNYVVTFADTTFGESTMGLATAASAAGGVWCYWVGGNLDSVSVRCVNASGADTDAKFSLTLFAAGASGATILGYAHADQPSSASYAPAATRSNNGAGGGAITATRSGTGAYAITFGGLTAGDIENVQIVPYGDATSRCTLGAITGGTVAVSCTTAAGAPTDAEYAILLVGKKAGGTARVSAFALCNDNTAASCATYGAYNDTDGGVTATRSATGTYTMTVPGQTLDMGAHVQVSAQIQRGRCNVQSVAGSVVSLTCTNSSGVKQDTNHAVFVVK